MPSATSTAPTGDPTTTRLVCTEGDSGKFWEGRVEGSTLRVRWGKLGTKGQSKDKPFPDAESAERELAKVVAEKLAKGYRREDEAAAPAASAAEAEKPKKTKAPSKKGSLGVRAAAALLARGDGAAIVDALAKDPGAADVFAEAGVRKLFDHPAGGTSAEGGRSRNTALRALLDAGLPPSLVGYMIAGTSWVLDASEKVELLRTHWPAFDAGARAQIVHSALWVPEEPKLVDFVVAHADSEALLGFLRSPLTNLGLERGKTMLGSVLAIVARLGPAELDRVSDREVYATWLMDAREPVRNDHHGSGLLHKAVGGAVPDLVAALLERGVDATVRSTQPTRWTLPSSTNPAKSGAAEVVELPAGSTAMDLATRCLERMKQLDATYASACAALVGSDKLRCEKNRAEQVAALDRYRQVVELLQGRGLVADPASTAAPKPTYDVAHALGQYLALCEAMGQDVSAARAKAERIEPPPSVVRYWRKLAEKNAALHARLEHEGLLGLVFESHEPYDDTYLSGEAADIAASGELLHAIDADAWYDVDGVVHHVHPEGARRVGTYDECMRALRELVAAPA